MAWLLVSKIQTAYGSLVCFITIVVFIIIVVKCEFSKLVNNFFFLNYCFINVILLVFKENYFNTLELGTDLYHLIAL